MSVSSEPICLRVLERLEAFTNQSISRVEEESYFDDFDTFEDAIKTLNLPYSKPRDIAELDDVSGFFMAGDSNTEGNLCIAFEHPDGSVTLLREVCERGHNGEPYVSQAWLPEYNFTKESPVSLDEQKRFLQMRFYDTSPKKPLVFRYVFMDDEQDETFKGGIKNECGKCEARSGQPCSKTCPAVLNTIETAKKEAEEVENAKAIELLISNGMMIKNAEGEYEFKNLAYKPTRIGVITTDS
jgi:hypothetical protein